MTVSVRVRSLPALIERTLAAGSQRQLADKVGISPTSINLLMQGKRSTVRLDTAAGIEDALGVPRGSLFVFTDLELVGPYTRAGADAA
ncbi:helix-turn-helix domain-containing protein [Amycolatopsis sp. cg5]|uniref:helix-turn-helix domain-containing protein n=1 Tax=Amycolatopsis sp. cg5 TaxID=3238802 RepID=UPI003525CBD0